MTSESLSPSILRGRKAGALIFGMLFALESLVRSLNVTVISLQAYDLLKESRLVSELSVLVSILVLTSTLVMPYILGRLRRRWAYTIGIANSRPSHGHVFSQLRRGDPQRDLVAVYSGSYQKS
jgi:hypothetical protein